MGKPDEDNFVKDAEAKGGKNDPFFSERKRFSADYLPALSIALITIALLLLLIFGNLFADDSGSDSAAPHSLHRIDFLHTSAFDDHFVYVPEAEESPAIIADQGFRWSTLDSKIRMIVPEHAGSLKLNLTFGAFNTASYDIPLIASDNYVARAFGDGEAEIASESLGDVAHDAAYDLAFEAEGVTCIEVAFIAPIENAASESWGFLYLQSIDLFAIY